LKVTLKIRILKSVMGVMGLTGSWCTQLLYTHLLKNYPSQNLICHNTACNPHRLNGGLEKYLHISEWQCHIPLFWV